MQEILNKNGIDFRKQNNEMSARIQELRKRRDRCVCKYCGNSLSLRKMTYAAYDDAKIDLFCEYCNRLEQGVEPEIYKIAEYYVDEMNYDNYPELESSERKRRMNIAIVCDLLNWGYRSIGILDEEGFSIDINFKEELVSNALSISDDDLHKVEQME